MFGSLLRKYNIRKGSGKMKGDELARLKKLNLFAAIFHLVQGVIVLVLANDFSVTITRGFLKFDETTRSLIPAVENLFYVKLAYLIASLPFITFIFHLLVATVFNKKYNEDLSKGINPFRWAEYSISSSIMMVIIAMLVGISDFGTLLLILSMQQ